jgi:hypothetical protein
LLNTSDISDDVTALCGRLRMRDLLVK